MCLKELIAHAADYGCTAGTNGTWVENALLDLQSALRDANGRVSPYSMVAAVNTVCTMQAGPRRGGG